MSELKPKESGVANRSIIARILDGVEWLGNKLPDPAVLFLIGMVATWILSAILANNSVSVPDPRDPDGNATIEVVNLLTLDHMASFLSTMVKTFTDFAPLGVVLVALLGVGVAEHSGFINTVLKNLLKLTPKQLLSPMLLLVAILSHTAADAGYVLVIPIGGVIFYAAGRHPLAGIACAFAGVSGGFSANFIVSGIDPMLSEFTQSGAQLLDAEREVNPLCNYFFTASSSLLIIIVGWILTDWIIEPRLRDTEIDGNPDDIPQMEEPTSRDQLAMVLGLVAMLVGVGLLVLWCLPESSALRAPDGTLTKYGKTGAPLMKAIVPLIFLLFVIPGIVHGYVAGTFKSHRDIIQGMAKSMETMGYYLVLVFFCALFIQAFSQSNVGLLCAVKGAQFIQQSKASPAVTIAAIILLAALVNLLVGSASAKWGMLSPIFVPMLMLVGISPELTQAAYRVGDSSTNIITPMMPYFPLVVVFCKRYVKDSGVGTVGAMMLPYSMVFLVLWTLFLLAYWGLGIPLGPQAPYTYEPPA